MLWLVSLGAAGNRAFIASGCASAAAAKGLYITLLEIGEGLPNVGYYFSLEPHEYAAVTVEPRRIIAGETEPNLRFFSCARAEPLLRFDPPGIRVDLPHLLVVAFDGSLRRDSIEDIGHRWMPEHRGAPNALCAFGEADDREGRKALFASIRSSRRDAFILDLVGGGEEEAGADETIAVPEHLVSLWRKRSPPQDRFFDDILSNVLQVMSHRRRRTEGHASIR